MTRRSPTRQPSFLPTCGAQNFSRFHPLIPPLLTRPAMVTEWTGLQPFTTLAFLSKVNAYGAERWTKVKTGKRKHGLESHSAPSDSVLARRTGSSLSGSGGRRWRCEVVVRH
jgi:hypothetical protein